MVIDNITKQYINLYYSIIIIYTYMYIIIDIL